MAFPTLSVNPSNIEVSRENATIKTDFEAGYQQTRERHTRKRKTFKVQYPRLDVTDRDLLLAHYDTVFGSESFTWTNPDDSQSYTVRYDDAPKYPISGKLPGRYDVTITLREV